MTFAIWPAASTALSMALGGTAFPGGRDATCKRFWAA